MNVIAVALDASLHDDKVQENCCRALLILKGLFALKGKKQDNNDILKQTEDENDISEVNGWGHEEEGLISLVFLLSKVILLFLTAFYQLY